MGREVNSGWYCTPTKYGWSGETVTGERGGGGCYLGSIGFSFRTIQLDDLHPLSLHVLTHEAEALVFKVTLEFRVNLGGGNCD